MKKLIGVAMLAALFSLGAFAQESQKVQVFGGYQFIHESNAGTSANFNGWNGAADMLFAKHVGVTADFSGTYDQGIHMYTYTFGPVVRTSSHGFSPFAHALFGGAHASAAGVGQGGMAMYFGGGADVGSKALAFRLAQFDWMLTRFNGVNANKNVRLSTGVLFRF